MRVALVCPYSLSVPGGVQGQVLGLAHALRADGHAVRIVAPTDGPPPEPGVFSVGPTRRLRTNGSVAPIAPGKETADRTLEALRTFAPDVIHLHEPLVPGPTHAALLAAEVPLVGTFHAAGSQSLYRRMTKPARRALGRLTVRTAVSEQARLLVRQALGGTYWVIPNGVEVTRFVKAVPWPRRRPSIFFVGRHEERKGLEVLLDAFSMLEVDAELWVAGDGPQTAALRARRIPDVQWLGRISDDELARRMRGATVFCAPSLYGESFGIVLLEGMVSGAAVVASAIPGYADVARADREALLFPPGDALGLAHALRTVLTDHELRGRLVAAGELRGAEFSMERLAQRFLPVYESALARGRAES
ncbi:MAG: glycosyltransferase family 4 protein [Acidimicrobiia bacterium]